MMAQTRSRKRQPQPEQGPEAVPRQPPRNNNTQNQNGSFTGSPWFQCILVVSVSAATFAVFYFPNLRNSFIPQRGTGLKWWQSTIIYQIYPRSFQDTDGDGVGDIKGITQRLDYFEYLGVEALWISPMYKSPMVDFGYDVQDFKDVDPIFGKMEDFEALISAAHAKGIKIIMDFIPNHTSEEHEWFQLSRQGGKNNPFKDFYVWSDGKLSPNGTRSPPNNWVSVFGGSMWEWDATRGQYYLHQFAKHQPDLNFRNADVQEAVLNLIKFWVLKGVDGFRMDAVRHMFEVRDLSRNEPLSKQPNTTPDQYEHYLHPHTVNQPETHHILKTWREYFDLYYQETGYEIFMVVEILDPDFKNILPYYRSGAHFPFNFNLQSLNSTCDGFCYKHLVDNWLTHMPMGRWPNWVLGSHDVSRISAKIGPKYVNALNMLLLLLPGTPTTYYGEEIGMENVKVSYEQTKDVHGLNFGPERYAEFSRDPQRSPMQWTSDVNAGFSTATHTWLPVHPNHKTCNVQKQREAADGQSSVQLYHLLAKLRRQKSFLHGNFEFAVINKNIFSFIRYIDNDPAYLIAMNIGKEPSTDNYRAYSGDFPPKGIFIPYRGYLVHNTGNMHSPDLDERTLVLFEKVTLHPGQGIVVRFWENF